jgi:hypothetical protein
MQLRYVGGGLHQTIFYPIEDALDIIPDDEKKRIEKSNFFITTAVLPTGIVGFKGNPFPSNDKFYLIYFEYEFLIQMKSRGNELAAILLHEIGHLLNPPATIKPTPDEKEMYADDYVRHCGFGKQLVSNLEYCYANIELFQKPITILRKNRILQNSEILLNLI